MALTDPSGAALTPCTVPILLPSEEITAKPTSGCALAGAVTDFSVRRGAVEGFSAGVAGFVMGPFGADSMAALGDGGVCVCAEAATSGMLARMIAAPATRTSLVWGMSRTPSC